MKLSRISLIGSMAIGLVPLSHASVVTYYPFDANTNNAAPSGPNPVGSLSGGATINTTPGFSKYGAGALALNSGAVGIGTFDFGNTFSITAWINPANTGNIESLISNVASGGAGNGFNFFINNYLTGDGALILETSNGTSTDTWTNPGAITFGSYQFVTLTVDRTAGVSKIYVNGIDLTAPGSATRTDFATNNSTQIGQFVTSGNFDYAGAIDEVNFYNTVLTPTEVQAAYAVPEPSTYASLLGGTALALGLRRRRADAGRS